MRDEGAAFESVLKEAQELGYAEADPTFDVEGIDAAHKLAILASIAFGMELAFESVYTEGISALDLLDVEFAKELGYEIKHLGVAKQHGDEVEMRVHPTLVPQKQLIASVNGVMNAVLVKGDAVGNTLHYGAGAGAEPTASAVVADLVDVTRIMDADAKHAVPYLGFRQESLKKKTLRQQAEFESAYYLRVEVADVPGVMSQLSSVLAGLEISIEALVQKEPEQGQDKVFVIFLTQQTQESLIDQAISQIENMREVYEPVTKLRVEHLD
jgi:homoserine dehydrogenase